MKTHRLFIPIWALIFFCGCNLFQSVEDDNNTSTGEALIINEFLASNATILADEFGEFDDWVEIYNKSGDAIDIGGMYIWGDPEDTIPFRILDTDPSLTTIAPRNFLLLWFDRDLEQGILHVDNKLSMDGDGEAIILIGNDGKTIIDSYEFEPQNTDISTGRFPDGSDQWITFQNPTPGTSNHLTNF